MKSNAEVPNPDANLLYDLEKALAESRKTTPKLLSQVEMQERGLEFMARLRIKCVKPAYPIPLDGDCLWSCFAMSRNPYLTKEQLKAEAFHFRLRGVGMAIECLSSMGEEQLAMVQSVIAEKEGEPQSREEIIEELTKYMQSGMWSGNMGDIMAPVAASGLGQGLIIIHPTEPPYCTYAAPDCEMFRGKEDIPYPCIAVQQGNHYESALVHEDSKESARNLLQSLKEGEGVTVRAETRVDEGSQQTSTPLLSGLDKKQQVPPANDRSCRTGKGCIQDDVKGEMPKSKSKGGDPPTRCDKCGNLGPLANHLRASDTCLQAFRAYPEFKLGGNDEEFITKVCLLIKECPVPDCPRPRGSHRQLPAECLNWWKRTGWSIMNWQGVDGSSSSSVIRRKMKIFRDNHNRRQNASRQPSQGANTGCSQGSNNSSGGKSQGNTRHLRRYGLHTKHQECFKCSNSSGPLAAHLHENEDCLHAYHREYFAGRMNAENPRRALFDLGLLLHFCPNPGCSMEKYGGPAEHLDGLCSHYIIDEAVAVYGWEKNVDRARFKGILKRKATYLRQVSKQQQSAAPGMFRQELSTVLNMTCCTCFIQGPLLDAKDHRLVECLGFSPVLWQCHKCNESHGERQNILRDVVRQINKYGGSTNEGTLKPVRIDDENGQVGSIIFMPDCLADDLTLATELSIFDPPPTTVLVPQHPDGLDVFDEEAIDNAFQERKELKLITEFTTTRIFLDKNPTTLLSVMFRKKLADIREERITILKSMQITSKGKVKSRNPNVGNIKSRNPHYAATKNLSLTNTCTWSEGYLRQRADESTAISCANGQVKTRVKIGVLKSLAVGSPELAVIMTQLAQYHFEGRGVALLSAAPIVLQFAKAKVDLLVKHAISQQYKNWDLNINFKTDEWGVDLVGFLYSSEYEEINKKIAREGASLPEILEAITSKPELQPTASLNKERIGEKYGMSAEEAEVITSL